ncbi:MAG TPA: excinuclease ABC subunit UvrA [Polyangiaceae bacterium]|nr:excinuclease ABC subunit UvrA [Polyangiaceae bacterium]
MLRTVLLGACTHNLKSVDLELAPSELVAITGVSGAGKSSLALDTLYAEGQRRFVESFSPYARQFLERLERPPMTRLEPVPAGIAVDRRAPVKSSRSTVATMSDLEPYLAALFLRESRPVCPEHGVSGVWFDPASAAEQARGALSGRAVLTYALAVSGTEHYLEVRESLLRDGYRRAWSGGKVADLDELAPSRALVGGELHVVLDRVELGRDPSRLTQAIELGWNRASGLMTVRGTEQELALRRGLSCPVCARGLEPARPGLLSYDSPLGACARCRGFGRTLGVDLGKVIPDPSRTLAKGAIRPWRGASTKWERSELNKLCRRHGVPLDAPWGKLTAAQQRLIISGDGSWDDGKFPGVLGWFRWLETKTYKMHVRVLLARYRSYDVCTDCGGKRLNATALGYRVDGLSLADFHALEVREVRRRMSELSATTGQGELARRELESRLGYLERVGLGYLTLDRQARTLSGGEAQRVTLTAALGTSLHNALFVLDEPTVGLHPSDVPPLVDAMRDLARRENIVLVVEHDPLVVAGADRVIELGPGAGEAGGKIVADGPPGEFARRAPAPARTPRRADRSLSIENARENNLRGVDVEVPLGVLCAVTGPSGSGKSTLVVDVLYRALARHFGDFDCEPAGVHDRIAGLEALKKVTLVDQSPLGRTSRGNAATYTKAWDTIRNLYAREPEAVLRGLSPSDFSFNVEGGRCEACSGEGFETVEMQFLADVRLICPVCRGQRFQERVLAVRRAGVSVAEVLDSTVDQVLGLFAREPAVVRALGPLSRLGLGYLKLGQPLSTVSGGEAQRLKLSRALAEEHTGALLVLDEPSAGLHATEVASLLEVLHAIVDAGGSVIVVEHDLDVIRSADFVIDLGPGAGADGGVVVASGTPSELAKKKKSRTAEALRSDATRVVAPPPRAPDNDVAAALSVTEAREHNLKGVSVEIPHGALSVVTGPSGSGKSTLAFDVIFAEGQRRLLETLTPYARQFLPTMPRPDVDRVEGVPPSIALEQRTARAGGKSTVATVTEVAHYLRLLFAKLGVAHCPEHDLPINRQGPDELFATVRKTRGEFELLAPVVKARKGTYYDVFTAAQRDGITSAYCDGELVSTDAPPKLARNQEHTIDLVLAAATQPKNFDAEALERALRWGEGELKLRSARGEERLHSLTSACPECGLSLPELDPRWFSFNTKQGRCERCEGEGVLVVAAPRRKTKAKAKAKGKSKKSKVTEAPEPEYRPCPECSGSRLAPIPRGVRVQGERYHELCGRSVRSALARCKGLRFDGQSQRIATPIMAELERRLSFLDDVGLDYLALDRSAHTLSGGEMQRLRLAAQLGAGLTGALYVLDEPTIGLHPRDTGRLLGNLKRLVDLGSTVLVVEHDADTIRAADHLIDLGPGGGSRGGSVVAAGPPREVLVTPTSPTGRAFAEPARLREPLPTDEASAALLLEGARKNNLKSVDLSVPLGRFTVVAGVSGSGKSTLVRQVLLPALRQKLGLVAETPGPFSSLGGVGPLERAVAVDQSPIGRTPRSVPATFLGIWDQIRALYASTPEAGVAGFGPARFSFNTARGGQCSGCDGQGVITHEMSFLPDVVSTCPACNGQRFEPATLEIRYRGLSIGDVLGLTAEQAAEFFAHHSPVAAPLKTLCDLGAGYITLGQGSHTLSGGEAQRLKLASELTAGTRHGRTLYVLDEPTTGLHLSDVARLIDVLGRLVERGDTLVVIEHHPQVMAGADWLVELGPEGGEAGGNIVAAAPPRDVARGKTPTAPVLREVFKNARDRKSIRQIAPPRSFPV